ncbi:hypothetical protein HIM_04659 [Hirsutella minnesotensis 3608]|uniref:Alkyl hydroperoxide reductase subunit C/ Thiol specific antioxidant domain-containing protein n=1 Tax=Hirsutella minnesotensis 3608 TaxID=1043627 RepID=A0A0F7ZPP0_9HYPO|nr:hypothetical protein HIM_04659 [Hirsutella minnesotensis 3608]
MFSSLTTKIALKKAGLPSNTLDFTSSSSSSSTRLTKRRTDGGVGPDLDDENAAAGWPGWMSFKSLPLTVHPWLSPPPPPVQVARVPQIGDSAPRDRDRKLQVGGGRRVLVVFLRCVGCAFAQKTFLSLRTLANRHSGSVTCIAVSHSSLQATRKWIDLLGGAWNVDVVVDEDRAVYAAWGLGVAGVWHLFNPTTQVQGWREKGWLGEKVAEAVQRRGGVQSSRTPNSTAAPGADADDDASNVLGNKWQEAGAFAVDGRGTVVWGGKAQRADDVMDLDEGIRLLCA